MNIIRFLKRNSFVITLGILIFFLSCFLIVRVYADSEIYSTIILRTSVFYLGAIVTINVYIYSKIFSTSPTQFAHTGRAIFMFFGVISSFIIIFLFPKNYYEISLTWNPVHYIQRLDQVAWSGDKVITIMNIILFAISTTIFIISLYNFVYSFNINSTVKKNYRNILDFKPLKKLNKIDKKIKEEDYLFNQQNIKKINYLTNEAYSYSFNSKELTQLSKDIDVFIENLCYLIKINHMKYIEEFIADWGNISGRIQSLTFHSKQLTKSYEILYNQTIISTLKVIDQISDNVNLKEILDKSLNILIVSLPMLREDLDEEFVSHYETNYDKLSNHYYKELLKGVNFLYFNAGHKDILSKLLHNESFNSIVLENNEFLREKASIDIQKERYSEHFLLSLLYEHVKENINEDLPVIMALLTKSQEIKNETLRSRRTEKAIKDIEKMFKNSSDTNAESLSMEDKKQNKLKHNNQIEYTDYVLETLILIIVKCCEIENYKAAGYLVKRISNSSDYKTIKSVIKSLDDSIYNDEKRYFLSTNITLNDYSLKYCFNKTIFLIILQIGYEKNIKINYNKWITKRYKKNIIDSFIDKHKEYNLYCIHNKYLEKIGVLNKEKQLQIKEKTL